MRPRDQEDTRRQRQQQGGGKRCAWTGRGPLHQTPAPRPRLWARHKARIVVLARAGGTPRDLVRRPRHARTRARAVCALAHAPTLLPAATPIGVEYSIAVPGTALPWRSPGQEHIFGPFGPYPPLGRRELGPAAGLLQRDFRR